MSTDDDSTAGPDDRRPRDDPTAATPVAAPDDDPTALPALASRDPRHALLHAVWTGACRGVAARADLALWPELAALADTPQDREWHAEGDVLTHTDMVLAECAAAELHLGTSAERAALRLACLLHDVAKPGVTRFDEAVGHVIAPGHERIGGVRARYLLHGTGLPHALRRSVAQLVATHHLVKRTVKHFDTPEGPRTLDRLAARVDTRLLWALELADMRGRVAVDRAGQIEIVELFRMLCEERGVFGRAPAPWLTARDVAAVPFASPEAARWALAEVERRRMTGELTDAHHALAFCHEHARHTPPEVIVTVGAAASGKSRALAALDAHYERISPDAEREARYGSAQVQGEQGPIHGACHARLREVLRRGGRAVYDATNVVPDLRGKLLSLCHDYGAHVTLWVFDTPAAVLHARNRARDRRVPAEVIARQIDRFEWPLPEEAHAIRVFDEPP